MTARQENALNQVRTKLKEVRTLLYGVMYYSDPLSDSEMKKVRAAYDKVCEANDQI